METSQIILLLELCIGILVVAVVVLVVLYFLVGKKKNKTENIDDFLTETDDNAEKTEETSEGYGKFQGVLSRESVFDFMDFDEIVDNMIVRKNRKQYVMVIQCNGINYDLMSEAEKYAVEEGFVQFLNTLRFPIQLYVQSRTLNLRDIIAKYENKVVELKNDLEKVNSRIDQAIENGNKASLEKLDFEKRRKTSVLEYARDITDYVKRLNLNENILQQKTYVVISYYTSEIGGNMDNYAPDEINNMCFSELYTRAQNIISALGNSQVTGRILDSEELAELLFIAYNRDDQELIQINKMLDAEYDSLYSTGKDVLEKKEEKLDQEINIAAIDLTTDSILKADKKKKEEDRLNEENKNKEIRKRALNILSEYENQLDPEIYEMATKEISDAIPDEKKDSEKDAKPTRTVTGFSARRVLKSKKVETED